VYSIDSRLCFVLMPFAEPWSSRVFAELKETLERIGYACRKADDYYGRIVLHDIWTEINAAAFIVAELTGGNPNVYYELRIAHTLGKEVIPIIQSGHDLPFDQRALRALYYSAAEEGFRSLRAALPHWVADLSFRTTPAMLLKQGRVTEFNANLAGADVAGATIDLATHDRHLDVLRRSRTFDQIVVER
jgi:hypothetical protein